MAVPIFDSHKYMVAQILSLVHSFVISSVHSLISPGSSVDRAAHYGCALSGVRISPRVYLSVTQRPE